LSELQKKLVHSSCQVLLEFSKQVEEQRHENGQEIETAGKKLKLPDAHAKQWNENCAF